MGRGSVRRKGKRIEEVKQHYSCEICGQELMEGEKLLFLVNNVRTRFPIVTVSGMLGRPRGITCFNPCYRMTRSRERT